MIAPQPFFEPRGTPISVLQRARGLASLGHTVDLATYHVGEDVAIPGVTIHRIPRVPFVRQVKIGPSWHKPFLDLLLLVKAASLLASNKYDAIHSHEEAAFFSVWLARAFRTCHVYDMHSSLPRQLANFNFGNYRPIVKAFEALERMAIDNCDALITIDSNLEQHVKAIRPETPQVTIENLGVFDPRGPMDPEPVASRRKNLGLDGRLPIVYAGTFERYQGIDLLIESAKIVRERYPEVTFVLAGGKPRQVLLYKEKAKTLQVQDYVHFLGTVSLAEANAYLEAAAVLVSPRTEGTSVPLKIYTYLHCGKPIVATDLPAHTSVLGIETAVLVRPTTQDLAEGILRVLDDQELGRHLGAQALRLAQEKYGLDTYLAKLATAYSFLRPATDTLQRT